MIKDFLIRESVKQGYVSKEIGENNIKIGAFYFYYLEYFFWKKISKILNLFNIDKERMSGVFDFLVTNNLIVEKN